MSTTTQVQKVKINKMTKARYGQTTPVATELYMLTDVLDPQYEVLPTADAKYSGQITQYTGTTGGGLTNGYFYKCTAQGTSPETYAWEQMDVQPSGGSGLPDQTGQAGKFLTTDGTNASWETTVEDAQIVIKNSSTSQYSSVGQISFYAKYNNSDGTAATISSTHVGTLRISGNSCIFDGSLLATVSTQNIGSLATKWDTTFTKKLSNGADINIPTTGGTMALLDDTSTTSTAATWSASKLNTMIGNIESLLANI